MEVSATTPLPPSPSTHTSIRGFQAMIAAITCVDFMETGMVTFAAGPIMAGLGLDAQGFAHSFIVYGVCTILMLYKHQWMVERLGYKRFVQASLLVFALGALVCATSSSLDAFCLGRALQGLGGATFFTAGRMQINHLPAEARFGGLVCFVGSLLGATALSPLLASGLLGLGGWRLLFGGMIPVAALVAWQASPHLPAEKADPGTRSQEHWGWLLALVPAVFGLQYALVASQFELLAEPGLVLGSGALAVLVLSAFALRQWHRERPLINYRGLLQSRYLTGILFYFFGYFILGLNGFLLPIALEHSLGLPLEQAALILSASMGASVPAALLHLTLTRRWPVIRPYMLVGLALIGGACLTLGSQIQAGTAPLLTGLVCGFGIPFFIGPVAFGTFTRIAPTVFSHAYQVKNIVRQLGLSSAMTVGALLVELRYRHHLGSAPGEAPNFMDGLGAAAHSALAQACAEGYTLLAALGAGLMVLVLIQRPLR